jgi:coenzyme F420-reducing hydrogenase beta subunit
LFPMVDEARCMECGKCAEACPVLHPFYPNEDRPVFYAFQGSEDVRSRSSSGGAFTYFANYVLQQNGVVYGAVFSEDYLSVHHVRTDTVAGLSLVRQSKYLESDLRTSFQEIYTLLETHRFVLFSGCPCQVAGLKAYLGRDYDNLLIVDLICNSVPSPLVWEAYVREVSAGRVLTEASFRDKRLGWVSKAHLRFSDGSEYIEDEAALPWIQPFINGITTRKSCHLCRFSRLSRQGDITLGDFWGIAGIDPTFDDNRGTSLISLNNEKGHTVFEKAVQSKENIRMVHIPFSVAAENIPSRYYQGQNRHPGREVFFKSLQAGHSYSEALYATRNCRYDFGLVSWWYGKNYGAALTSFALYKVVEEFGYHAILTDHAPCHMGSVPHDCSNLIKSREYIRKYCDTTIKFESTSQLDALNFICNGFIIGSDQLFATGKGQLTNGSAQYYLDFAYNNRVKLTYGTSFGHDRVNMDELDKEIARYFLSRFDAVSSREVAGVAFIRNDLGLQAEHVLDPVFLVDQSSYRKCMEDSSLVQKDYQPFVLAYILRYSAEKEEALKRIAEQTGKRLILVLALNEEDRSKEWTIPYLEDIYMEDWLFYFDHASFVVSDSFHGVCLSIIFEKPFIGLTPWMGEGRFRSLADSLGLSNRVLCDLAYIKSNLPALLTEVDYGAVREILSTQRTKSLEYLKRALSTSKVGEALSDYDISRIRFDKKIKESNIQMSNMQSYIDSIQSQIGNMKES